MEHVSGLYADEINAAIKEYKNFCKRYDIQILKISKIYQWDTNQSYYKINFSNEEEMFVHIPSELHSKKRTIVGLIKMENVQKAI